MNAPRPKPGDWWRVRHWPLWSLPPRALAPIVLVIVFALILPVVDLSTSAVTVEQLSIAGLLTALGVVHTEILAGIERTRRDLSSARPALTGHTDLSSVWIFAGALLLPPAVSATVAFVVHTHLWLRSYRPAGNPAYRSMFSRATMMLACYGVGATVIGTHVSFSDGVTDLREVGAVLMALLVYLTINTGLVVTGVSLAAPDATVRSMLSSVDDNILEVATLGLGAVLALLLVGGPNPWTAVFLLPILFILHRSVAAQQMEREAATDDATGLLNSPAWHRVASRELNWAARRHQKVWALLIELDNFSEVKQTRGRSVSDAVLGGIGEALARVVPEPEMLGRLSAEEFVLLLPSVDAAEVNRVVGRLKSEVARVRVVVADSSGGATVEGLSASVGGVLFPDDGQTLQELLVGADRALQAARRIAPDGDGYELRPPPASAAARAAEFRRSRLRRRF